MATVETLPPYQQPQQQQPNVIVVNPNVQPTVVQAPLVQSFVGHMILACFTFWFCGLVCGLVAFILAGLADKPDSRKGAEICRSPLVINVLYVVCIYLSKYSY